MAKLKAHEVDTFIAKSAPDFRIYLIYGPDRGLVSERSATIAKGLKIPLDDPFSVIRLEAGTIHADPARLADEALTVSMFGGERLVWIKDAGNEKGLVEALKALASRPPDAATVIIEADDLKPASALRSLCENSSAIMALPCYADDAKGVDRLIDSQLSEARLTIALDARQLLKGSLGGDRLASRSELEKLLLYSRGSGQINIADVEAAIGDVSASSMDELVDAILSGNTVDLDVIFAKLTGRGTSIQTILSTLTRQLNSLMEQRFGMDNEGKSAATAVASARPPIFFARKALVERILGSTSTDTFLRYLARIQSTVLESRKNANLANAICHRTLLAMSIEQSRGKRR